MTYFIYDIVQELIQNADDAQATKVGFLLDWRDHPSDRSSVMFDNFEQYQGPALLAWNDGVFKKEDWRSLCKINQSSKENDFLKVGRFGLGFQSVFHITGKCLCYCISGKILTPSVTVADRMGLHVVY